jgi:hypothetical protein
VVLQAMDIKVEMRDGIGPYLPHDDFPLINYIS